MKYLSLIILLISTSALCQQNIVPNGSFEVFRQDKFDAFNDAYTLNAAGQGFHTSHLGLHDPNIGIFNCWEMWASSGGNLNSIFGIVYGIIPNFYPAYNGSTYVPALDYSWIHAQPNNRIFSSSSNSQKISLTVTPNNLFGLDCSPPDTHFGTGITAQDGLNYLAIMDIRYQDGLEDEGHASKPFFGVRLKENVKKNVTYKLVFSIAKMNRLDDFQNNEGWTTIANPEITFHIGNLNNNQTGFVTKQKIHDATYSDENWETVEISFTPNKDYEYLRIQMDPFNSSGWGIKMSGCFLDNIKIYETCETPTTQCNNENYRRDMLDVKLDKVDRGDPLAYPDPLQNDSDFLKSIRAINLDNVKRLEMKIYTSGGSLVRTIDQWYPNSEYVWDGRYDSGTHAPEGGYTAIIHAVSNDCFHNPAVAEKSFQLKRKYTLFDNSSIVNISIPNPSGGYYVIPAIIGLERVHNLNLKVYPIGGQSPIYEGNFINPPNIIALTSEFGNPNGLPQLATGSYIFEATLSNNCSPNYKFSKNVIIAQNSNFPSSSPIFNWTPVTKPSSFACPFAYNYQDNYLPPRDCCTGSLYISDVDIYNDFVVNIQNNIYFGNNVSFGNSSENYFFAGNIIDGAPGLEIPLGSIVELVAGQYNCVTCIQEPDFGIGYIDSEHYYRDENEQDTALLDLHLSSGLYPNPTQAGTSFSVVLLQDINPNNYEVNVLDAVGKRVDIEIEQLAGKIIQVRLPKDISQGFYHVKVHNDTMIQSFKLRVVN